MTCRRHAPQHLRPAAARSLTAVLLLGTCLTPVGASAQTWIGATGAYAATSNWNPATVPSGVASTATFTNTGATAISLANLGPVVVGTFQFDSNAQSYAFGVSGNTSLVFRGSGIVNTSGVSQTINASGTGSVQFRENSSLGNATFNLTDISLIADGSGVTGGTATINTNGDVSLDSNADLQSATVNLTGFGRLRFLGGTTTTGGQATVNMLSADSEIRFTGFAGTGTAIGSLSGSGLVFLTDNLTSVNQVLTIGGNNQSTVFSGSIREGGSIVKEGTGTLSLTGNNNYSGGTTLNTGTLAVGHINALGTGGLSMADGTTLRAAASVPLANAVTLNGTSTVDTLANALTLSGVIDGTGNLTKTGSGTLTLLGANTYSGGTIVNAGTLRVAADGSLGNAAGGLTLNGGTLQTTASFTSSRAVTLGAAHGTVNADSGTTLTVNGVVGGAGDLIKAGAGTLVLGNTANTYTGMTRIDGGTVSIGANNSLGGGVVQFNGGTLQTTATLAMNRGLELVGNGTLQTDAGTTLTANGDVSGVGGLTKTGSGTLILGGANTYTGGTTVSAGILQGNASSLQGNIVNNASVVFEQSSAGIYAGDMSGSGGLTKRGAGVLTLSGTNSQLGATRIEGGALSVGADTNLGGANASLFLDGGTLRTTGSLTSNRLIGLLSGGGTFDVTTGTVTLNGTLQDELNPGSLTKAGAGTLILGGTSSYTGGTTVSAGTLQGTTASLRGDIVNNATLAFDQASDGNHSGTISGTGGLTKSGTGTVTLTGTNSYQGGTAINGGAFSISSNANLGAAGGMLALDGGTLRMTAGMTIARTTTLGAGNGAFDTASGISVIYDGAIGGGGGLIKTGGGTLILGGANTYSGGTLVSAGTLRGTTSSLQGNIVNNSVVEFNQAGSGTYAGILSGTGSVTVNTIGTVTLSGANSYSGGTVVSAGTLNGTTSSLQGNIVNNSNVTFSQTTTGTYAGTLSGTGSLQVSGTGTVILTGANSYSGGTTVSGGILQGNTTSLQGNIVNNAQVVFDQPANGLYVGNMSGSGSVTMQGGGLVNMIGSNSYTGGTALMAGILQGNTASLQGNITNNATVVFNQTTAGTYTGAMSGTGGLVLQGGGLLNMTGANTYSGPTTVNDSTLAVNGSIASNVTVNTTGTLGGNGAIFGSVVNNGTLAPGNSIGTLRVSGAYTQAPGSTYQVEVNAAGQNDRLNVTGGPGTATLQGGTVQVLAAAGSYGNSTTYTILNATGGVSGTYANVTSNFAFLTPSLAYDANNVFLTLALQGSTPFSGFGGNTNNQRAVGTALDRSYANATGDFATVIGALAGLSTQQASPTLGQISGQPIANFGTANVANASLFMNALGQQMAVARGGSGSAQRMALAEACDIAACDGASPFCIWGSLLGGVGSVQGNGNTSTFTYNLGGTAAGIDYRLSPNFLVGLGAGYTTGTQWVDSFMGRAWSNSVGVAAYASFTQSNLYLDALAGYAYSNNQLQRQIQVPGLQSRQASGSAGANQFLGQVETGYRFGIYAPAAATVTPFARFQAASIDQAAFNEWGASSLSLNVAQQTTTSLRTTVGAELAGAFGPVTLGLRLGWLHEYADTARPMTAAFAGAPAAAFTVYGATPQRDSAVIGLQAGTRIADNASVFLRYDGELNSTTDNHALNVGVRITW